MALFGVVTVGCATSRDRRGQDRAFLRHRGAPVRQVYADLVSRASLMAASSASVGTGFTRTGGTPSASTRFRVSASLRPVMTRTGVAASDASFRRRARTRNTYPGGE